MDEEESGGLQELLLLDAREKQQHGKSIATAVFNLSKVIIGAGMMAIPRAYLQIGSVLGTAMLIGVALLIYFTLVVLVRGSAVTGAATYSQLALVTCGGPVMKLLQLAVLAFCFGFGVIYLVIIRDLLLGTPPACNGLLCELFGMDPSGALADPRLVIAAVALLICSPLLLLRSMERLSALNAVGISAIALLAATAAALALQGLAAGTAHSIPAWPQWQLLGPTRGQQLEALTAVLPVLIACYNAAQSLHPLMPLVQPYSEAKMRRVIGLALGVSFGVYWTLSVGAAAAFGEDVEVNVLNNLSVSGLQPLVGPALARLLSWGIRGGYLLSLLASLLLYMHPLRGCLAEMLWPEDALVAFTSHLNTAAAAAANSAAGSAQVANSSSGTYAVLPGPQQQQQQQQADHNPIDDSRVLLSFDSMDQPAFGSWAPGFLFRRSSRSGEAASTAAAAPGWFSRLSAASGASSSSGAAATPANLSGAGAAAAAGTASNAAAAVRGPLRWQQQEQRWYYVLTYGLLAGMVVVAVAASNIWEVLSAVGDLASTIQAFVVPGLIALVLAELLLRAVHYVGGSFVIALGLALFANGIYQRV
ncbi:hypothetical protein OEZ85_005676 [Tetradesmus obliquus]|uniref:Amino acid transporter transmembrane domain-containing protein n=2 Tax=Tetradesmus obliquus TaxID=3088 RepID=A0ABY8UE32_TETOB|nr:hypothetical protein OEZ85_005676 [Tetradesmus obliquus]